MKLLSRALALWGHRHLPKSVIRFGLKEMIPMIQSKRHEVLRQYANDLLGTHGTIQAIGADDYADPIIAMAQADLDFPKPAATPAHEAQVARASPSYSNA